MPDSAHISLHIRHRPEVTGLNVRNNGYPLVRTEFSVGNVWMSPFHARQYAAALLIAADEADPPGDVDLNVAATLAIAAGGDA